MTLSVSTKFIPKLFWGLKVYNVETLRYYLTKFDSFLFLTFACPFCFDVASWVKNEVKFSADIGHENTLLVKQVLMSFIHSFISIETLQLIANGYF